MCQLFTVHGNSTSTLMCSGPGKRISVRNDAQKGLSDKLLSASNYRFSEFGDQVYVKVP